MWGYNVRLRIGTKCSYGFMCGDIHTEMSNDSHSSCVGTVGMVYTGQQVKGIVYLDDVLEMC